MPDDYPALVADARADERTLVQVERSGAHAVVTMDEPERLNPLSAPLTVQPRAADRAGRGRVGARGRAHRPRSGLLGPAAT